MANSTGIMWFRRDFRLADNRALRAAAERYSRVVCVYIHSPDEEGNWPRGAASNYWLHHSLLSLQAALAHKGNSLIIRTGPATEVLRQIASETQATGVVFNRLYEPHLVARDEAVTNALTGDGIACDAFPGNLLLEPWDIMKKDGTPYKVFTAFAAAHHNLYVPSAPLPAPRHLPPAPAVKTQSLEELNLEPRIHWTRGIDSTWDFGEPGALKTAQHFITTALESYETSRNIPGSEGVSRLSPYLHFGEISPRQVWEKVADSEAMRSAQVKPNAISYQRELIWREFSHHLLYHFPTMPDAPLNQKFSSYPWQHNEEYLAAWQQGKTGYPIVDAGMRQLWETGWMHNRVRMITASFLIKDLGLSWRTGQDWFWDTLVDADLAQNSMNWQWVAGCGVDAAPFFRIFNPTLQSKKFDPDGTYIRRYVPELAGLPAKHIHEPAKAPAQILKQANLTLGQNYPNPIIDHAVAREQALRLYKKL